MKRFLLSILISVLLCSHAIAAGPTIDEANYIQFTAADQETDVVFYIYAIAWVEDDAANTDIAADDDMTLEDGSGTVIISKRGAAAGDELIVTFPFPILASGLKAEDLDGGILYVYGKRK